jgi:hypothetical protein
VSYAQAEERSEWPLDNVARCRKKQLPSYAGTHRQPRHADEAGAVVVVDLIADGRAVFRPEPSAKDWLRITLLPSVQ